MDAGFLKYRRKALTEMKDGRLAAGNGAGHAADDAVRSVAAVNPSQPTCDCRHHPAQKCQINLRLIGSIKRRKVDRF
jgi:hypothetical protein